MGVMTATPEPIIEPGSLQVDPSCRLAFSSEEVAALLGISVELVKDLIRSGELKSSKAGRRRLISRRSIDDFLAPDSPDEEATVTPLPARRSGSLGVRP